MGSESTPKRHVYDISKSKRTRRTTLYLSTVEDEHGSDQKNENDQTDHTVEEQKYDHVQLKQLIKVDDKAEVKSDEGRPVLGQYFANEKQYQIKVDEKAEVKSDEGRPVLSQYFADEKQLQLVVKQPEDGPQGVKLKKVLKRYVKALGHMVKSKRNQRLDKPTLRLPM